MNKGICGIDKNMVPTSIETKRPALLSHLNFGIYDKQKILEKNPKSCDSASYFLKRLADASDFGLIGKK